MPAKKKAPLIRSAQIDKTIESSIEKLQESTEKAEIAVTTRSKDSGKQLAEIRKLRKKAQALANKKKKAVATNKKSPAAQTAKLVTTITREVTTMAKEIAKAVADRQKNLEELSALRASVRRGKAYVKAMATTDKALNKKPVKRKPKPVAKPKEQPTEAVDETATEEVESPTEE